jgi:hypothetical protein
MKLSVVLLGVLALTACSSSSPWRTFHARGVTVRYPPGWFATGHALTPVTSPVQVLAVASYPLPRNDRGADGCSPKAALDRLPTDGAFIFGWEYGAAQSSRPPPRPKHFELAGLTHFECLGPSYKVDFREAGRWFQIHIVLGRQATPDTNKTVLRVLDSFRADTRGR